MPDLLMSQAQIDADPASWLARRREGITGTDIATILGHNSFDSPFALWHRKAGNLPEIPDNDRMRIGRILESYVVERFWEAQRCTDPNPEPGGLWGDGWRLATLDRALWRKRLGGERYPVSVLECKTVGGWQGWGADGTDEVPPGVRAQALWGADVLGVPVAHVGALNRSTGEFRSYVLEIDDTEMDGWKNAADQFLASLRSTGIPPPVDRAEETIAALKALHVPVPARRVVLPLEVWSSWRKARATAREAAAEAKCWDARLREYLKDAEVGVVGDLDVVRRQVSPRAGYTVPPGTQDKLTEIKEK